ncbi:MAG: hypothetical protein Q9169_001417 [Polycauliona sp. 2 TL-2023]
MHSYIQLLSTPTADTTGTAMILDVGTQRYLFGNVHEGLQRACIQRNAKLSKTSEVFITGTTEWKNVGGLFGLILTLADANAAAIMSEAENTRLKNIAEKPEQRAARSGKLAKIEADRRKALLEAGLDPDHQAGTAQKYGKHQLTLPTLTIHGGRNLIHTVATGRRFIFRKGMPVNIIEHSEGKHVEPTGDGREPDWTDDSIQVWKLPLGPASQSSAPELELESPRKRNFDDFAGADLPSPRNEAASVDHSETSESREDKDQELRRFVVAEMFNSQWRLDALFEISLRDVHESAMLWIRNPLSKQLERYFPPADGSKPDIKVLARRPWPGALVEKLPATKPSKVAMSYIVRHHPLKGKFLPEKAKLLNVNHLVWGALQSGTTVMSRDRVTVTPDMVMEPPRIGGGFAVLDLPSKDYLASLLARPEWTSSRIMNGLQAIVWILGPGLARDQTLQAFMQQHSGLKHVVSAPDISPNYIAFDSTAALLIRLNQIDSQRYQIPIHSNVSPLALPTDDAGEVKGLDRIEANRNFHLQLEPKLQIQEPPGKQPFLDTREVLEHTPQEVLAIAEQAREDAAADRLMEKLNGQNLPSQDAEIICLGTGSSAPSKYRNVSATLLRVPGCGSYLFDCGEGTLGQLRRLYSPIELEGVLRDLKAIWISHMHADHHLGTTSVIKAWHEANYCLGDGRDDLPSPSNIPMSFFEAIQQKSLFVFAGEEMTRWLAEYSSVEAYGNRAMEKATGMKNLRSCFVDHCKGAQAVTVKFHTGFGFSYSGDCRPCEDFTRIGRGSTVLVHEATFDDDMQGDAMAKKHSTMSEAIGVASAMRAKRLILTHFSQRYQKLPNLDALNETKSGLDTTKPSTDSAKNIDATQVLGGTSPSTTGNDQVPEQHVPSTPPAEGRASPVSSPGSSPPPSPTEHELKIAIAFDFLRVRVGDIASIEKFTPAVQMLFEMLEKREKEEAYNKPGAVAQREKAQEKQERNAAKVKLEKENREAKALRKKTSLQEFRSNTTGHEGNGDIPGAIISRRDGAGEETQRIEFIHKSSTEIEHVDPNGIEGQENRSQSSSGGMKHANHTRFNCDVCEHPILGIGRTSTQTTLASIETNAAGPRSWRNEPDSAPAPDCQPSGVPVQSPPLRVDTLGNSAPLSTIAEGISPVPQSSAVLTPAVSGDLRSMRSTSREWVQRDKELEVLGNKTPIANASVPTGSSSKAPGGPWIRQSQHRFREKIRRHLRKPRSFNISRLGLHVDVSPTPSAPGLSPLPVASTQLQSIPDPGYGYPIASIASTEPRANLTSSVPSPVRSNPVSLHSAEPAQQPAARPDPLIGRTLTSSERRERIRAFRREATLKRQAELMSRCECQSECQCRHGSVPSNAASVGPDSSERSIQVPMHHLHRLFGETEGSGTSEGSSRGANTESLLVGIGSHLTPEQVDGLPDQWTNVASDNRDVPSDRISQASTVYVRSNGSTVSLSSRRPASLGRSSTTPASIPRRSAEGLRPDVREVLRNRNILDLSPGPAAAEVPLSPRSSDSDASPHVVGELTG